jgi:hypothetical protein
VVREPDCYRLKGEGDRPASHHRMRAFVDERDEMYRGGALIVCFCEGDGKLVLALPLALPSVMVL